MKRQCIHIYVKKGVSYNGERYLGYFIPKGEKFSTWVKKLGNTIHFLKVKKGVYVNVNMIEKITLEGSCEHDDDLLG